MDVYCGTRTVSIREILFSQPNSVYLELNMKSYFLVRTVWIRENSRDCFKVRFLRWPFPEPEPGEGERKRALCIISSLLSVLSFPYLISLVSNDYQVYNHKKLTLIKKPACSFITETQQWDSPPHPLPATQNAPTDKPESPITLIKLIHARKCPNTQIQDWMLIYSPSYPRRNYLNLDFDWPFIHLLFRDRDRKGQ